MNPLIILFIVLLLCENHDAAVIDWGKVRHNHILPKSLAEKWKPMKLHPSSRIIGGFVAKPNSLPYQIGLLGHTKTGDEFWCGGSLLSNEWAISAAHCFEDIRYSTVFLGAHNIEKSHEDGRKLIKVPRKNIFVHPHWNEELVENDIALIKFPKKIDLSDKIKPINLPQLSDKNAVLDDIVVTASGWGQTSDSDLGVSKVLKYVKMHVITREQCNRFYEGGIGTKVICTSGSEGLSTCEGDSGGPLIIKNKNKTKTLVGITSFGSILGCEKGWPIAFTRVSSYLSWIKDTTGL